MLTIQNNLMAMNANRQNKLNTSARSKTVQKLSSGYRINKAADDAAGLAISEKMRRQIRGLMQGTENAQDGISWVQIGDGSLEEAQDMLHRMTELSIKSLNETNTNEDRAYMQMEFEQLQTELDRLTKATTFNDKQIFREHESPYYQYQGNIRWPSGQKHIIQQGMNDLTVMIRRNADWPIEEATITVPSGVYTTQELMDEIDDAFEEAGLLDAGVFFEYTDIGTCNLNLERGLGIESVGGYLSYLLYDTFEGGSLGALIGTTVFPSESAVLPISAQNNHMSFTIQNISGAVTQKDLTLDTGYYTRSEIIDKLNEKLADTTVRAMAYGDSIKLASDDSIITGFKGNMFKIDRAGIEPIYTSVFYDNVQSGNIVMTNATFTGGAVLPTELRDIEHQRFVIDGTNDTLVMQPNNAATATTLTIDHGNYTAGEMATKLNQLFTDNGFNLTATVRNQIVSGNTYQGITITSGVKGALSTVGIDATHSSAYDTLFTKRVYNGYVNDASTGRETTANKTATFTGGKVFTGDEVPLAITAGQNDQFKLNIKDGGGSTSYLITIPAGSYASATDLAAAIDDCLNGSGAALGYKGKVHATASSNKIMLSETVGSNLTSVTASTQSGNDGYSSIFVGKNVTYTSNPVSGSGTSTTPPSVTTSEVVANPATVDSTNNRFTVSINGNSKTVTLPTGSLTRDQIVDSINAQLAPVTTTSPKTFQDVNATGKTTTNYFTKSNDGQSTTTSKNFVKQGTADLPPQGMAGSFTNSVPAKVTMDKALADSTVISSNNKDFTISINGVKRTLVLQEGTYTRSEFVTMLQGKIDAEYTPYFGGAKVSLVSNCLSFEARSLTAGHAEMPGSLTRLEIGTTDGGFVKDLYTTHTQGTVASNVAMKSSVQIDGTSNTFAFRLKENGAYRDVNVTLNNGTYNRSEFISELNRALTAEGVAVSASLNGSNQLVLTTKGKGTGNGLVYEVSDTKGGNCVTALYGPLKTETPASATANQTMQDSITIAAGSDQFNVTVNGVSKSLTLSHNTYTKADFIRELNTQFAANGLGLTASLDGSKIKYTTTSVGSAASFSVTYAGGGNAMKAIYGENTITTPGAVASFTGDGKLKLTGAQNGGSISVSSSNTGLFQKSKRTETNINPTSVTGYHSTVKAYVDGVNLTEPVVVDALKDAMSFYFYEDGQSPKLISFEVPQKSYTFPELQTQLQSLLDAKAGSGKITATVNASGVRFEVNTPGSTNYMRQFEGEFYDKVFCSTKEKTEKVAATKRDGNQSNESIFTVGRKDVKSKPVDIKTGTNDELSLDFTYGGSTITLKMTLSPARYNSETLKKEIQSKLDAELEKKGLSRGLIEVGVGGISTGIVGSNDANALNFKLSNKVQLPAEGEYIIDGVSGNAAFTVFYQTDGEIENAYITGTKDISKGVIIKPGQTMFGFEVDGTDYSIDIPAGKYSTKEIVDKLNEIMKAANIPVTAENMDGNLRLNHAKYGRHVITNVYGPAKKDLFFQEEGGYPDEVVGIKLSSQSGDYIDIDMPVLNTVSMGINSCTISKTKYAAKAVGRLKKAIEVVSTARSMFGAKQNHLEHAIANNENKAENTQAAESRIRDADIAKEVVQDSIHRILEQANVSMMSQANQEGQYAMQLIRG